MPFSFFLDLVKVLSLILVQDCFAPATSTADIPILMSDWFIIRIVELNGLFGWIWICRPIVSWDEKF
jgi:hypothetical protein